MGFLNKEILLLQPLSATSLSKELQYMAAVNGFQNLDAMLSFPLSSLLRLQGFTPDVQQELMSYLEQQGILSLVKQY